MAPAPKKRSRRSRRGSRESLVLPAPPRARKALKTNGRRVDLAALAARGPRHSRNRRRRASRGACRQRLHCHPHFPQCHRLAAETVDHIAARYGAFLDAFNVFSVMVFSIEYLLRLWNSVEIPMLSRMPHWRARLRFAARPIMIIDLLAVLPWYLQPFLSMDLRALRVLRLFRLLKLVRYSPALQTLGRVIEESIARCSARCSSF